MVAASVRQIPLIGDLAFKAGHLYNLWVAPCSPDPWIMFTGFFMYTPQVLWTLVKPNPQDEVSMRFGEAHKRKRRGRMKYQIRSISPNPGRRGLQQVLVRGHELKERVGFFFLIADATLDGLINWTSLAYVFSGCDDPDAAFASAQGNSPQFVGTPEGEHLATYLTSWDFFKYHAAPGGILKTLPGPCKIGGEVLFQGTTHLTVPPAQATGASINVPWALTQREIPMDLQQTGPQTWKATIAYDFFGDGDPDVLVRFKVQKTFGTLVMVSQALTVQGTQDSGFRPDP